jgi:hypothetical protein
MARSLRSMFPVLPLSRIIEFLFLAISRWHDLPIFHPRIMAVDNDKIPPPPKDKCLSVAGKNAENLKGQKRH